MTAPTTERTSRFWNLKRIQETAASALAQWAPYIRKLPQTTVVANINVPPIPPLDLPYPHDILAPILTLKISDDARTKILQSFDRRIKEWQDKYSANFQKTYIAASSMPYAKDTLPQVYQDMYRRSFLPVMQSQVETLLGMVTQWQQTMPSERKRPFNIEYIPLLETYFENNAYPSALDRRLLAQKSIMTPRQIEVWFQNHRNRAKKDGKILKRLTDSPSKSILESLEREMPHLVVPASERTQCVTTDNSDDDSEGEAFDTNHEPEHVNFCIDTSATYVDAPSFDRRFIPQPFAFPSLIWRRKPTCTPIPARVVDMDGFISAFSRLNMREGVAKKPRNQKTNRGTPSPWFASTTTVPSCAPHPALIIRCTNKSYHPSMFSTIQTSTSGDRDLRPTSFTSSGRVPYSRKIPNLSRRAPSATPFNKYIQISSSSPSGSPFVSRTPSLSSVASSQSRSSSYSSISSQEEPKTPPESPSVQQQEFMLTPEDFAELEALFQGPHAMLDGLLSQNLAFDLPPGDFSKQASLIMPVVPSYSAPPYSEPSHSELSYSAPSYSAPSYPAPSYSAPSYPAPSYPTPSYPAPSYSKDLNNLLFIPDTNFLQV